MLHGYSFSYEKKPSSVSLSIFCHVGKTRVLTLPQYFSTFCPLPPLPFAFLLLTLSCPCSAFTASQIMMKFPLNISTLA